MTGQAKTFEPGEMPQLLSYIWADQYFEDRGNPQAGRKVFFGKSCTTCHSSSERRPIFRNERASSRQSRWSLLCGVMVPTMLDTMKQMNIQWPRLTERQMSDLIGYLNSPL